MFFYDSLQLCISRRAIFCICGNSTNITKTWSGWLMSDFCACVGKTCNAIVLVTTCNGCIVYVTYLCYIFFTWDKVAFMSRLFYGKCYVTVVIRELSCSPIAYLGKFLLWEEIVSNHFYSSKSLVFIFVCYPLVFKSIIFLERFELLHFIFFLSKWQFFLVLRFTFFHSYEKTTVFLEKWWLSVISQRDAVKPLCWLHKLHELPS